MELITSKADKMYGWERLSRACGLSCKMWWPWTAATAESLAYDAVNKDDVTDSGVTVTHDIVTSEPQRPVWADLQVGAPIVRNMSSTVINAKSGSYERLSSSMSKLDHKTDVRKASLKDSASNSASSSVERLHVCEMVTTV